MLFSLSPSPPHCSHFPPFFSLFQTGTLNPFSSVAAGWGGGYGTSYDSAPTFVDLDGNGLMDAFVGGRWPNQIYMYKNVGTTINSRFVLQTAAENILDGLIQNQVGPLPVPIFIDTDGDNDMDLYVGHHLHGVQEGKILFFKNTGNSFVQQVNGKTNFYFPKNTTDICLFVFW